MAPDKVSSNQAQPDEQTALENRHNDLLTAINSLPAEQKDTLVLKMESGLDLQTIAEVTGVNPETAKSRLRYAVKKLKQMLANLEVQEG